MALAIVVYRTADMLAGIDEQNKGIRIRLFDLGRQEPNEDGPPERKATLLFDNGLTPTPPTAGWRAALRVDGSDSSDYSARGGVRDGRSSSARGTSAYGGLSSYKPASRRTLFFL